MPLLRFESATTDHRDPLWINSDHVALVCRGLNEGLTNIILSTGKTLTVRGKTDNVACFILGTRETPSDTLEEAMSNIEVRFKTEEEKEDEEAAYQPEQKNERTRT